MKYLFNMKAFIDADILLWECCYGAETGWVEITKDPLQLPPFDYVLELFERKLIIILEETRSDEYDLYLTNCRSFRYDIAKTKPYKGHRKVPEPWHFKNLREVLIHNYPCVLTENGLEADDAIAIKQCTSAYDTIIVSRDKDLRQVPGWFYSWEIPNQPSFGPYYIEEPGWLEYNNNKKLTGVGYAWWAAQMLMGDPSDNIPGLPKWGPKKTYDWLKNNYEDELDLLELIEDAYINVFGEDAQEYFDEMKQLTWILRE